MSLVVSVIVPTRNRASDLARCLDRLVAQDFPAGDYEVVVCDDGSEEDVRSVVERFAGGEVEVRYLRLEPRGPAAARNAGIRAAGAGIVAMTDSDTTPDGRWLSRLVEALEANPRAAGVEGRVFAENDGEFGPLGEGPVNDSGGVYLTCNCAYRRDVLFEVGGFDETFPMPAYEDTDLAARILEVGEIVWQPEAVVVHPKRRITLRSVWKKLSHWEYVTIMGYRYGYLGWKRYPVRFPRVRVPLLAVLVLPACKLRTAVSLLLRDPVAAARIAFYGAVESVGALTTVVPRIVLGIAKDKVVFRSYL